MPVEGCDRGLGIPSALPSEGIELLEGPAMASGDIRAEGTTYNVALSSFGDINTVGGRAMGILGDLLLRG